MKKETLTVKLVLMVTSLLLVAGVLETGARLIKWEWHWTNFLRAELEYFWAVLPVMILFSAGYRGSTPGSPKNSGAWK